MRIITVDAIPIAVPLRAPLKMAVATVSRRSSIVVRLRTDDGLEGVGDGVLAMYFTGETLASAVHLVRDVWSSLLIGANPFDISAIGRDLDRVAIGNSATRSAVEIALYDLIGRALNTPLHDLLGGRMRTSIPTIWHVSSGDLETDASSAAGAVNTGFQLVKVKVAMASVSEDVTRVRAVRQAVGDDVALLLDANQGWSPDEAIRFARLVHDVNPGFIEQPVPRSDVAGMARVCRASPVPIAGDEGIFTARDLYSYLRAGATGAVVLKLIKAGGVIGAAQLAGLAQAAGIGVHFAGMPGETSISAAAAVHLASALPELRFGSGIAAHYLMHDIVTDPLTVVDGAYVPPSGPGLGVDISQEALDRFRVPGL